MLGLILVFGAGSKALLMDADTGWHIRNGEHILRSLTVPQVDYFSWSMAGRPWYAWEWLYDVIVGAIHIRMGLNGILVFSGLLIAITFALLFRCILARTRDFTVSLLLALLAAFAAQVHMLARPHILTWSFTLFSLTLLLRFQSGKHRALLWLPPLMLLWVNVHGGFLIGLSLIAIFLAGSLWSWCSNKDPHSRLESKKSAARLGTVLVLCFLATFVTPYGYRLHAHIASYLSNRFLIDNIQEFLSPSFSSRSSHVVRVTCSLAFLGAVLNRHVPQVAEILLALFAIHCALYSARNIPISAIILSLAIAPWLSQAIRNCSTDHWLAGPLHSLNDFSARMAALEHTFRGHLFAVLVAVAICGSSPFNLMQKFW